MGCSQSTQAQVKQSAEKAKADHDAKNAPAEPQAQEFAAVTRGHFGPNSALKRGEETISEDSRFKLVHQNDGNVVLYHAHSGVPKWATNTDGKETTNFIFQSDGNIVLYNNETPVWASDTHGKAGTKVILQNDGNIVLYTDSNEAVWASNTCTPDIDAVGVDAKLWVEDYLKSTDGRFKFLVQSDGNAVVYGPAGAKWATDTCGKPATHLLLQGDGNLVLYNGDEPTWASNTVGSNADRLIMQNDGNLVLYAGDAAVWASNTNE